MKRSSCTAIIVSLISLVLLTHVGCKSESPSSSGGAPATPATSAPATPAVVVAADESPIPEPSSSSSASAAFSSVLGIYSASNYCRVLSTSVSPVSGLAVTIPATSLFGSTLYEGKAVEFKKDGSFAYFTAVFSDSICTHLVLKYSDDQTGTFEDTIGALDAGATDQRVVKLTAVGAAGVFFKVLQDVDLSLKLPSPLESIPADSSASAPFLTASPWIYKKIVTDADHRTADSAAVKAALASDTQDYQVPCKRTKSFPYAGSKQYGFESAIRFYANGTIIQDSYFRDTLFNTLEVCIYADGELDRVQRNLMSGTYSITALGAVPGATVYAGLLKIVFSDGKFGLTNNPAASTYTSQLNFSNTCGVKNWSTAIADNPKNCNVGLIGTSGETRTDTYLFTFDLATKAFKILKFNTFTFAEYTKASGSTPEAYGYKIIDDVTLTQP